MNYAVPFELLAITKRKDAGLIIINTLHNLLLYAMLLFLQSGPHNFIPDTELFQVLEKYLGIKQTYQNTIIFCIRK